MQRRVQQEKRKLATGEDEASDKFLRVKYIRRLYRIRNSKCHITKQAIVDPVMAL